VELAEIESNEIAVIKEFLPRQLSDKQIEEAVLHLLEVENANSIRDMGRVIGKLKEKYSGKMDFSIVAPLVKKLLLKT
jgi:hypothetical protein